MKRDKKQYWVLLDDEGKPVRFFDYPATGTVKWKIPSPTLKELYEKHKHNEAPF